MESVSPNDDGGLDSVFASCFVLVDASFLSVKEVHAEDVAITVDTRISRVNVVLQRLIIFYLSAFRLRRLSFACTKQNL